MTRFKIALYKREVKKVDDEHIAGMLEKIFAWSITRTFSREEEEELTQEITLQAMKSIGQLRHNSKFSPWFWRLADIALQAFTRGKAKNRNTMSLDEVACRRFPMKRKLKPMKNIYISVAKLLKYPPLIGMLSRCTAMIIYPARLFFLKLNCRRVRSHIGSGWNELILIQNTNAFISHSLCVIEATLAGLSMRETTVAHKRSITWLSVPKTSLRNPFSRISSHICSMGLNSGV